jgi:membrane peptidoglycan carboxypeptidase
MELNWQSQRLARLLYHLAPNSIKKDFDRICSIAPQLDGAGISPLLIKTLLMAEDHRFYWHPGFDIIAIVRAIYNLFRRRRLEGASTIEQQFVRTVTNRYELSLKRKIREIYLAMMVACTFQKDQIARNYLCVAYFGWNMNGLFQACSRLNINPEFISYQGVASLIARIRYPEPEHVSEKRENQIRRRTSYILAKINGT